MASTAQLIKMNIGNRRVQRFLMAKIDALNKLVLIGGFANNTPYISEKDLRRCHRAWEVLHSDEHPLIKTAAAGLLDMLLPEWRTIAPPSIIGPVVDRNSKEVSKWIAGCKKRDGGVCVECGQGNNIQVHHVLPWAEYPSLRVELFNGVCLCGQCHHSHHQNLSSQLFYN